jgi:hypothetical protein
MVLCYDGGTTLPCDLMKLHIFSLLLGSVRQYRLNNNGFRATFVHMELVSLNRCHLPPAQYSLSFD